MRRLFVVLAVGLLWASVAAAQFVGPGGSIPVVANNPGVGGTYWRSDVSVLNLNDWDVSIVMYLLPEIRDGAQTFEPVVTDPVLLPANSQRTMANVVQTEFGLTNKKGALSVLSLDGSPLVMSSRTYTFDGEGGSYGQDVHAILAANQAWVAGVRNDSLFRTNVGIFLPVDPMPGQPAVFTVTVFDADGAVAGQGSVTFPQAGLQQKSLDAFGADGLLDGYVVFRCSDPTLAWYAYASRVDQATGDAVYRAARGRHSDLP
ncbi:MAG TPA: hypothetical protein PKJ99_01210 [Thermoanaerobaculales bacterium]|nr:hypothetical protein [Thermoanaerobaculales bacterium]HPA79901.1 hypothetical protein [Thermoanaerobaculales bacterium]HQL29004.1 hypothetical protein [Thermoanaerobaculales bacterium]HQN96422.1 hypothetical protein [Thermoanaerobaculales bacterium]HQP42066.1 hypothetical protein [Thermoanaerobaculales bacterium]